MNKVRYHWFSTTTHNVPSTVVFETDETEQAIINMLKALKALRGA